MWANVIPYFAIARFLARVRQFWNFNLENLIRSKNEKIVAKNSQRPEKILIKAKIGPPFAMYQLDMARSNENRKINIIDYTTSQNTLVNLLYWNLKEYKNGEKPLKDRS